MGGLLLKLLKITCYDCILQPLSAQSEDMSSSSCLSWSPCTCTSSLSTSEASTPQQGAARLQRPWEVGTLSSKASWVSAQPGRGWPVTQVLRYVNETFGKRCCRRQKGERAKITNKKCSAEQYLWLTHTTVCNGLALLSSYSHLSF